MLGPILKNILIAIGTCGAAALAVTIWVQRPAPFVSQALGGTGPAQALIVYHPSRDSGFSDDLSLAVATGFRDAGLGVTRMTLGPRTPGIVHGVAVVAVISNTYWGSPDRPTRQWLSRAKLEGLPVIGIMAGAGSTDSAEQQLGAALEAAGAGTVTTRSEWIFRPNGNAGSGADNRRIAYEQARDMARRAGKTLARSVSGTTDQRVKIPQ